MAKAKSLQARKAKKRKAKVIAKPVDHFRTFLDFVEEADSFYDLAMRSIAITTAAPAFSKALFGDHPPPLLSDIETLAARGKEAMDSGFYPLRAHMIVVVWAAFESAMPKFLVALLVEQPQLLQGKAFAKTKIPPAPPVGQSQEPRMSLIVERLQRRLGGQAIVDRFVASLDAVELGGKLPKNMRQNLVELYKVRNLIAHQAGIVDAKFTQDCPWLHVKVGRRFKLTRLRCKRYIVALLMFAAEIADRITEAKTGKKPRKRHFGKSQVAPLPVV